MSLRTKTDKEQSQVNRAVKLKAAERLRAEALTVALAKLDGSSVVIKGADATPSPAVVEHPNDLSVEERSAVLTRQSMPVAVREIGAKEKPWLRGGVQFRPMTRREREEEENAKFDKIALDRYADYCELVQQDIDLSAAYEAQRRARESRERRTGTRQLPSHRDRTISLAEAKAQGYICQGDD